MSDDFPNLSPDQKRSIKLWLKHCKTQLIDANEVYRFFNDMVVNPIDFEGRYTKPVKKEGLKSARSLRYHIKSIEPYFKHKYEQLAEIEQSLNKDIESLESRDQRRSTVGEGKILQAFMCLYYFEKVTGTVVTNRNAREGDFNSFLRLYFELRDSDYQQDSYEVLISKAIEARNHMNEYLDKAYDEDSINITNTTEETDDGTITTTSKITITSPTDEGQS